MKQFTVKQFKSNLKLEVTAPVVAILAGVSIATLFYLPHPPIGFVLLIGLLVPLTFYAYIRRIERRFKAADRKQRIELLHRQFAEAQMREIKLRLEETNRQLEKTHEQHQLHISQTPLAMIQWSRDYQAQAWNPAAELMFGYFESEAIGRTANELIVPPDLRQEIDKVHAILLEDPTPSITRNENVTKQGRRIMCEWHNTPLVNTDGDVIGVSSIVRDISTEMRYEEHLRRAKQNAENANKSKSRFMANMSHELRTPMNAIMGFSELLREEPLSDEQLDYIETIYASSRHLLRLINDVLDISKIESGKEEVIMGVCSLRQMLIQLEDLMRNDAHKKNLTFNLCIREDVPHQVISDAKHLYQCLINLVGNAIKFTEEGSVSLHVGMVDGRDEPTLYFEVADTGIGVPKDRQEEIFKSFEQADPGTNRKYGGTGLGLTITKELVEMMGGALTLESQVGVGSTFTITLPIERTSCPIHAG